jgi:hypothetical protein
MPIRSLPSAVFAVLLVAACAGNTQKKDETKPDPKKPEYPVAEPLATEAMAGQKVCVLPLSLVLPEDSLAERAPFNDRAKMLAMTDSLIGIALEARAPSVEWLLPAQLREVAKRAPGVVTNPDRMGQSVLRSEHIKDVPDPLWSNLRTLTSITGGREVLVPSMLEFFKAPDDEYRAELSLAVADSRTSHIPWRTVATGIGSSPERAITAAMNSVLVLSKE